MNKKTIPFLTAILVITITQIIYAAKVSKDFSKTVTFHGKEVVVKTTNGSIQFDSWNQDKVKVEAEIEVKASDMDMAEEFLKEVKIVIDQRGDELVIEPDHPKLNKGDRFIDWIIGNKKPEVCIDFQITGPKKGDVDLSSVNGSVEVHKIEGHAKLKSVNGRIKAEEIDGAIDARTTNGAIYADLDKMNKNKEMVLNSVNGGIKVYMPEDVKTDIKISTVNGSIHTDFPLSIEGKWSARNVQGKINGGGQEIEIGTVNGSVSLYKKE